MSVLKTRIGIGLACERRGISNCCLSPPKNSRYKRQPEIRVRLQARIAFELPEMKLKTLLLNIRAQTDTQVLTSCTVLLFIPLLTLVVHRYYNKIVFYNIVDNKFAQI